MKSSSIAKVTVCLIALFALGGVCGFAVSTRQLTSKTTRAQWEERWIERRLSEDASRLSLTPEQLEKARPLYSELLTDIRKVREEAALGVADAVKKQSRGLWHQLTPEQQKEFMKLGEERRARFQKNIAP